MYLLFFIHVSFILCFIIFLAYQVAGRIFVNQYSITRVEAVRAIFARATASSDTAATCII